MLNIEDKSLQKSVVGTGDVFAGRVSRVNRCQEDELPSGEATRNPGTDF